MNIFELNTRVQGFDLMNVITDILKDNSELIIEVNKDQMYSGKTSKGEYIRPYYSENPYFKKPGAALRYAQWKAKITPDSRRPLDVPNLYVVGKFYGQLKYDPVNWTVGSSGNLADKVLSVHENVLGLSPENMGKITDEVLTPSVTKQLQAIL